MGDRNDYMREYMREYRANKKAAAAADDSGDTAVNSGPAPVSLRAARIKKIVTEGRTEEYTEHMHAGAVIGWLIAGAIILGVIAVSAWWVKNAPPLTPEELARRQNAQVWLDSHREPEDQEDTTEDPGQADNTTEDPGQADNTTEDPGQE